MFLFKIILFNALIYILNTYASTCCIGLVQTFFKFSSIESNETINFLSIYIKENSWNSRNLMIFTSSCQFFFINVYFKKVPSFTISHLIIKFNSKFFAWRTPYNYFIYFTNQHKNLQIPLYLL